MPSPNHGGELPFSNSHQHGVATTDTAVLSPAAPPLAVVHAGFPLHSTAEEKTKMESSSQMMTSAPPPRNIEDSNNNRTDTSGVAAPVVSENGRNTESNTNGAAAAASKEPSSTTALKDPLQPAPPPASSPPEAASKEGNSSSSSMTLKQAASGTAPSVSFATNNPVSTTTTFTEDATSTGAPPPPPQPADLATANSASATTLKDPPVSSPRQQPHGNTTTASGHHPTRRALGKRPSPWREPRIQLPPPAKEVQVQHHSPISSAQQSEKRARRRTARRAQRRYRRLFCDCITVRIPLTVTADLGVAVQRTREKRVTGLYEQFPALKQSGDDGDADQEHEDEGASLLDKKLKGEATTVDEDGKKKKKLQKLKHVPQRNEYASVLDYLEAKYVQGVVVDDGASVGGETGDNDNNDDDEGQGSVYSETSFLDDTGLQRTVAEQVLGHTTTTKLELQDDDAFFVNVGDLEVEENEMTQQTYDPLEDTKGDKNKKPRKRKKAIPGDATKVSKDAKGKKTNGKTAKKKSITAEAAASTSESPKKKKAKASKDGKESKPVPQTEKKTKTKDAAILKLQKTSETRQAKVDRLYAKLVQLIQSATEEALPRKAKPEKTRVTITCPMDKNPGDAITFVNPHMNQKLKCNVPQNIRPGGSFKVTVPKPAEEIDPDKDYNRLGRKFYDTLETYARTYDEWCDTEGEYRKATGDKDFNAHFSKRNKFDKLTTEFPNQDLKTVVDKAYLQKILRRARQNKHKRKQQQQQAKTEPGSTGGAGSGGSDEEDGSSEEEEEEENAPQEPAAKKVKVEVKVEGKKAKPKKMALVPHMTLEFITKQFDPDDFNS